MKQYENQIRKEEFSMQREQFSKKQKSWIKQMKKNQFKGSQLNDELKETEVIRKLV